MVIDGISLESYRSVSGSLPKTGKKIVFVGSWGGFVKASSKYLINVPIYTVDSWTLEQYKKACDEPSFYNNIKENQMMTRP